MCAKQSTFRSLQVLKLQSLPVLAQSERLRNAKTLNEQALVSPPSGGAWFFTGCLHPQVLPCLLCASGKPG